MTSTSRSRARRYILAGALAVLVLAAGFIAALPWVLALPRAQRWLATAANKIMAPGSVEFRSLRISWFLPTEATDFVLRDHQGEPVLTAPRAVFGWNLRQILFARPPGATLTFHKGDLDIERFADGTVDLYETLKPVLEEHPKKRLVIRVEDGRLRFRDPLLAEPLVADRADIMVDLAVDSQPIAWKIDFARNRKQGEPAALNIEGNYSRAAVDSAGRHDYTVAFKGSRWPWTLANNALEARGEYSGTAAAQLRSGRLRLEGDAAITDLVAIGDVLASDTIHLDAAQAKFTVERGDDDWTFDRLELSSPLGSITGHGSLPPRPGRGAAFEGTVELAALSRQLPATLHLRDDVRIEHGSARLRLDISADEQGRTEDWIVSGAFSDLVARQGSKTLRLSDPATASARLQKGPTTTKLQRLEVQTPFFTASGSGDVDRGIAVTAALDLAVFRDRFRDWIDLGGIELAGTGKIDARYRRSGTDYEAGATADFRDLRVAGLPLVEKFERNQMAIEAALGGPAAPSGWPEDWRSATLTARSDPASGRIAVVRDAASGVLTVDGRAQTERQAEGRRERIEGTLKARGEPRVWEAERISLVLIRDSKWGPGIGAGERIGWQGKGRYDPEADELVLESLSRPPQDAREADTWMTGNQKARLTGLKALGAKEIEASLRVDLRSISRLLEPKEPTWTGELDAVLQARSERDLWNLKSRIELHDLAHVQRDGSPLEFDGKVGLGVKASYQPRTDRLELIELGLSAPYVRASGAGTLRELTTHPDVKLSGSLDPDWEAICGVLRRNVERRARIAGRPRAWRLAGRIEGVPDLDRLGTLDGQFGVQIDALDVFGMRLANVPVTLRAADGKLHIDPIDARLNGGALHIESELVKDKHGSTWLRLGSATALKDAVVNDEVSHRVLSYAAPVLDGATRVEGRVSLALDEALFPVMAPPDAQALVKGDVLFHDVRFMPGPLADELLSVFQWERKPLAVLRDPISVRIAGRKVYQEGLVIPVGDLATIGLEGTVDFDKNLDMVARVALNAPRSGVPILSPILENARFELPISGTLSKPRINGEALKERWKGIGKDLLGGSVQAGMSGLQRLLEGLSGQPLPGLNPPGRRMGTPPPPRTVSPDDPPPLTNEERRQLREERRKERLAKKARRRAERSQPPE
jgi:translocation and assembly module TamB